MAYSTKGLEDYLYCRKHPNSPLIPTESAQVIDREGGVQGPVVVLNAAACAECLYEKMVLDAPGW